MRHLNKSYTMEYFPTLYPPESLRGAERREHLILLFLACHDFDFKKIISTKLLRGVPIPHKKPVESWLRTWDVGHLDTGGYLMGPQHSMGSATSPALFSRLSSTIHSSNAGS